jgi:hypothetical protein
MRMVWAAWTIKGEKAAGNGCCIEHSLFRGLRHGNLVEQQEGREDNTKNPKQLKSLR